MQADAEKIMRLLKTARGQMDGIIRMVEENRYCVDISNQVLATRALLHTVNKEIVKAHMEHCIKQAFQTDKEEEKIEEFLVMMDKMMK
ncbi:MULTISPECIES: metal-sensing transcriptional repressor [Anaerosinus]|uniref:Copper-sensing transcriptional repressor CsoR n=1 Tax=Selenobaculum gibii TaxID=3054208 RepID=A0A9Y2AK95_9FIRM|nr:metal-sensing transcriptional repressor [Selenobaculum gbiensis]WIW71482.1 metal-sensing transcriptional repressor [Selenobaculum gbiensis]